MIFCKHDWKILSEIMTESKIQQASALCLVPDSRISIAFLERKLIQIVSCSKCGKLKRFVEEV